MGTCRRIGFIYRDTAPVDSLTANGLTEIKPTYQGMTFKGWGLYGEDGTLINSISGGSYYGLGDFRDKGTNFTVTDRWTMKYRIFGKPNNAECTAADKSFTQILDDCDNYTNITANIGEFNVTYYYTFEGYSFAPVCATADAKDPDKTGAGYVSIPISRFTYDSELDRWVATVYGQWYKNFNIRFVSDLADGTSYLAEQPFQLWLSTIDEHDPYSFTAPEGTPIPKKGEKNYSNCYTFTGDWSREQKQLGVIQTQAPITAVPLSEFTKYGSKYTVFLYAVYNPVDVHFVYEPYYMVDTVVSDENAAKFDGVTVTDFPADMDPTTYTVTRNYDRLSTDGGYQLAGLSAPGFEFKGWAYATGVHTYGDKAPDYVITNSDVKEACDKNGATITVNAKWHRYSRYTFVYGVNDAEGAATASTRAGSARPNAPTGNSSSQPTGSRSTRWSSTPARAKPPTAPSCGARNSPAAARSSKLPRLPRRRAGISPDGAPTRITTLRQAARPAKALSKAPRV